MGRDEEWLWDGSITHWSEDAYWVDALEEWDELSRAGQKTMTLDLDAITGELYKGGSAAYRLMEAMVSVYRDEGMDGFRGAPRLVLALLVRLQELSGTSPQR